MSVEDARICALGAIARVCIALSLGISMIGCAQTSLLLPGLASAPGGSDLASANDLALSNGPFPLTAIDQVNQKYVRQRVHYPTQHPPGTVVVDPDKKFLYLVMENGTAFRYGIGVGREGFGWSGTAQIARKARWPRWTPPAAMIRRQPELNRYRSGMDPGPDNPLGARALYLFQNGRDTLYRIHGTNEPWSIGKNISSGCIRLLNQDVIDLFSRVLVGARVVVLAQQSI